MMIEIDVGILAVLCFFAAIGVIGLLAFAYTFSSDLWSFGG